MISPIQIQSCLISTVSPSARALDAIRRYRPLRRLTSVGSSALMYTSLYLGLSTSLYFSRKKLSRRKGRVKDTSTGGGRVGSVLRVARRVIAWMSSLYTTKPRASPMAIM